MASWRLFAPQLRNCIGSQFAVPTAGWPGVFLNAALEPMHCRRVGQTQHLLGGLVAY